MLQRKKVEEENQEEENLDDDCHIMYLLAFVLLDTTLPLFFLNRTHVYVISTIKLSIDPRRDFRKEKLQI